MLNAIEAFALIFVLSLLGSMHTPRSRYMLSMYLLMGSGQREVDSAQACMVSVTSDGSGLQRASLELYLFEPMEINAGYSTCIQPCLGIARLYQT